MVSRNRSHSPANVHLGQDHEIFRVGVKWINARLLKVSSRSAAFLGELFAKRNEGFRSTSHTGEGLKLQPIPTKMML